MSELHIADAEGAFQVVNITPDFCVVGSKVVPFDISRPLTTENKNYAHTVQARGSDVLPQKSVVQGVNGNAGAGIGSGVSQGGGNVVILEGSSTVVVEGRPAARHGDLVHMNTSG